MTKTLSALIIDDKHKHLIGISEALAAYGIKTLPILHGGSGEISDVYKKCDAISKNNTIRIIISDLQMTDTGTLTEQCIKDTSSCLKEMIKNLTHPYIILVWTQKIKETINDTRTGENLPVIDYFKKYINDMISTDALPKPVYIGEINKEECLIKGEESQFNSEEIFKRFSEETAKNPGLCALLSWEKDACDAVSKTVDTIFSENFGTIEDTLTAIIKSIGGNKNNREAYFGYQALYYLLRNRLTPSTINDKTESVWKELTKDRNTTLSPKQMHYLNMLINFELPSDSDKNLHNIIPGQIFIIGEHKCFLSSFLGEEAPNGVINDDRKKFLLYTLQNCFVKSEEFVAYTNKDKSTRTDKENIYINKCNQQHANISDQCIPIIMEITPYCDFAQRKRYCNYFVYGCIVDANLLDNDVFIAPRADYLIVENIIYDNNTYKLILISKYCSSISESLLSNFKLKPIIRMRETLLLSTTQKIHNYNSRIGTISF